MPQLWAQAEEKSSCSVLKPTFETSKETEEGHTYWICSYDKPGGFCLCLLVFHTPYTVGIYDIYDIYCDTKRSQKLPHYSLSSKEFQSTLFPTSLDKVTERKQKWLKLRDNMCQLSPFWLQTALPSKDKKLPYWKPSQKRYVLKTSGMAVVIPLIHIG